MHLHASPTASATASDSRTLEHGLRRRRRRRRRQRRRQRRSLFGFQGEPRVTGDAFAFPFAFAHAYFTLAFLFDFSLCVCVCFSPFLALSFSLCFRQLVSATRRDTSVCSCGRYSTDEQRTATNNERTRRPTPNPEQRTADSGQRRDAHRTQNADRTRHNEQPNTELMMALCGAQWQMPNWRQVFTIAKKKFFTRCALSHTLACPLSLLALTSLSPVLSLFVAGDKANS